MKSALPAIAASLALAIAGSAQAQQNFDQAAYLTCKQVHDMQPDARRAVSLFLAEHAARYHGVVIPDGELGTHIALLVRGGCTLAPDAYLFTVIDRAIVAELKRLPKRQ